MLVKSKKLYNKSNIPIDVIISPEIEVAKSLYRRLEAPGALDSVPFAKNKVKMLEISVEKGCPVIDTPLKQLTEKFPNFKANILGAVRKEKFIFLKKNDKILEGDNVYLVVSSDQLNEILKAFGHDEKIAKKIIIIGGGNIGLNLAKLLETNFEGVRVKIIEKDKSRAEQIATELSSSILINGDGLDEEILKEANVNESETFLALTNDDENNNVLGWRVHGEGFPGGNPDLMGPGRTDMEGQVDRADTLSYEEMQRTPDDFQAQGTLWGGQTLPFHKSEHLGSSDRGVTLMRKTYRNILEGKVPEAFPKPATEEPDGPKARVIYSFDSLVNVNELPDKKADFEMIGALGKDMADVAVEIAERTDDQTERDRLTKAAIKKVEAAYQAKY